MIKMSEETKQFVLEILPDIDLKTVKINDLLDMLDDLMLDSLGQNYTPTEMTRKIDCAYDVIFKCN